MPEATLELEELNDEGERTEDSRLYRWSIEESPFGQAPVVGASKANACLDYRDLLLTHFVYRETEAVDVFDLLVKGVLRNHANPEGGLSIEEHWSLVNLAPPPASQRRNREEYDLRLGEFNSGLTTLIGQLVAKSNELLTDFDPHLEIALDYDPLNQARIEERPRSLVAGQIQLGVKFRGETFEGHHLNLNEARLSAIAICLYLSSILIQPVPRLPLLVLDDLLIGLDIANRLPVMSILDKHFNIGKDGDNLNSPWQCSILTHDRVWFESLRLQLSGDDWTVFEMYESICPYDGETIPLFYPSPPIDSAKTPTVHQGQQDICRGLIDKAVGFLTQGHLGAAANYARTAFELRIRMLCSSLNCETGYNLNPKDYNLETLKNALVNTLQKRQQPPRDWLAVFNVAVYYRDFILNPQSHPLPHMVTRGEILAAIHAIRPIIETNAPASPVIALAPLQDVIDKLAAAALTSDEALDGLAVLQGRFRLSVEAYCRRKPIKFEMGTAPDLGKMFSEAKLQHEPDLIGVGKILLADVEHTLTWLVRDIPPNAMALVDDALVRTLTGRICPVGAKVFLDDVG